MLFHHDNVALYERNGINYDSSLCPITLYILWTCQLFLKFLKQFVARRKFETDKLDADDYRIGIMAVQVYEY